MTIQTTLETLAPRLQYKANFVYSPEHNADDLSQEAVLAILEKAGQTPTFADQTEAYIYRFGVWAMQKVAQSNLAYHSHVVAEEVETSSDEEDSIDILDLIPAETEDPEEAVILEETINGIMEVVSSLSPENQTIVKMLWLGESQDEIARQLGITKGAVSQRKAVIARRIAAAI